MSAWVPVIICVAGALLYGLSANPKVAELGKIAFAAGLFAIAFTFAGKMAHLF